MKLETAALLCVLAAAACSGAARSTSATPVAGTYAFNEHPRGMRGSFEGTFMVVGDTILVDATPGPCYVASIAPSKAGPIAYNCGDVNVAFDRIDPLKRSIFNYVEMVQERKTVCALYETTPSGQQRCARTSIETTEKPMWRRAPLHPFPAPAATKP
jgi:hypothetical protein